MKVLGIDYGRNKIGLALGDTETGLVEPLDVWSSSKFKVQSSKLVKDNEFGEIVIGLSGGQLDEEIKKFGNELAAQTNLPVEFFDETLSTHDAQKILIEGGRRRKFRKTKEDAVAAALVLQLFLERRQH